jgi:hypothetical protein
VSISVLSGFSGSGSSSSTDSSFAIPNPYLPGDVAVIAIGYKTGTTLGIIAVTSNGNSAAWVSVGTRKDSTTAYGMQVFYRVLTAADGTACTVALGAAVAHSEETFVFRGVDNANPVDVSLGQANASSTSIVTPAVTTLTPNTRLCCFFGILGTSASAVTLPGTLTADAGGGTQGVSGAGGPACKEGGATQAAIGTTGTFTGTYAGTAGVNVGWIVALREALQPAPLRSQRTNVLLRR